MAEVSRAGRSTADGGTGGGTGTDGPATPRARTDDLLTQRTGQPGGTPDGHPTTIRARADDETRRSTELENSGAVTIADAGYRIKQNPTSEEVARARQQTGDSGRPTSKPDYLVEGRVFDCSSPAAGTSVRNVWSAARKKVREEQTQRVVLNLEGWDGDMASLQRQFDDWPIDRLKEVKAITPDGEIVQINLPPVTSE